MKLTIARRYDRSGTLDLSISHGSFGGIDADADGNIWITQYDGLRSYDPSGNLLGYWPNPRLWEGNISIDESRGLLYQGYQTGGIEVIDINHGTPTLLGQFPTAEVARLQLAPDGVSLQVVSPALAPLFWDYGVDGIQRPPLIVPSVASTPAISDAIVVQIPEPASWIALLVALACRRGAPR